MNTFVEEESCDCRAIGCTDVQEECFRLDFFFFFFSLAPTLHHTYPPQFKQLHSLLSEGRVNKRELAISI